MVVSLYPSLVPDLLIHDDPSQLSEIMCMIFFILVSDQFDFDFYFQGPCSDFYFSFWFSIGKVSVFFFFLVHMCSSFFERFENSFRFLVVIRPYSKYKNKTSNHIYSLYWVKVLAVFWKSGRLRQNLLYLDEVFFGGEIWLCVAFNIFTTGLIFIS